MKWFIFLLALTGIYTYGLLKASDVAFSQVEKLNSTYQYIEANADNIAGGQPIPVSIVGKP